ncbi:MAG: PAS domain-containing sensor histidine kinase [Holosporaceae bacterium]|jgi:PAS domain S-box-containing protein|nr:PAS domain-containing sensor histidine kinase [Holosporaceae bacterium]
MLKKIVAIIKTTLLMWICILVPLLVGSKLVKSSSKKDIARCVDTFMQSEGVNLSKYIALQFENTKKEVDFFISEIQSLDLNSKKDVAKKLKGFIAKNNNIISISLYNKDGKFLAGTLKGEETDLGTNDKLKTKDEINYGVAQREDGLIILDNMVLHSAPPTEESKDNTFYLNITFKWNQYEKYMNEMQEGAFPRTFYIISPDCKRYVALNALPKKAINARGVAALGMHLTSKIKNIPEGFSDQEIESIDFRVFKNEIKIPQTMKGNKFFILVATNDAALQMVTEGMFGGMSAVIMSVIIIWLAFCILISRFYNASLSKLEIANTITDSTPLATVIFKASNGKIMRINLSATTALHIEEKDIKTVNIWNLFISERDKDYILGAISSNINVMNYEVLLQSFGGGSFWGICSASPIVIDDEMHVVLAILDINRRKEIEKKLANNAELLEKQVLERTADLETKAKQLEESNSLLEKAQKAANEANEAKSKFLTNVSNELKTPINAIIGYGEILQEEALDRKDAVSADDLRKIIGSAKHLLSLVDEILDLSKIEAGKIQLFFENVDIHGIIKDVEGVTMPLITENNNSLFLEYQKNIGVMYTDALKLRQCLLNLLSNAAKFTEFGKITLRASAIVKQGIDYIEFSVIDTGIGIDPDKISDIFNPFQDVGKKSGAGLGLSITKKYIELLGGAISAESESGVGSKFIMRIPRTCTVKASEFIEIKNRSSDEVIDEFKEEYVEEEIVPAAEELENQE